jgi:hypothetical protein
LGRKLKKGGKEKENEERGKIWATFKLKGTIITKEEKIICEAERGIHMIFGTE